MATLNDRFATSPPRSPTVGSSSTTVNHLTPHCPIPSPTRARRPGATAVNRRRPGATRPKRTGASSNRTCRQTTRGPGRSRSTAAGTDGTTPVGRCRGELRRRRGRPAATPRGPAARALRIRLATVPRHHIGRGARRRESGFVHERVHERVHGRVHDRNVADVRPSKEPAAGPAGRRPAGVEPDGGELRSEGPRRKKRDLARATHRAERSEAPAL